MQDVDLSALELLTVPEVAKLLRLSKATVWRLVYAWDKAPGTGLESVKAGRLRRVAPEAVIAYKERLRGQTRPDAA